MKAAFTLALLLALALPAAALAHARVSPPVSLSGQLQLYSLVVPTEKENLRTTEIELTVPSGFGIDSFVAAPGWKRTVESTGSGDNAVVQKVTWTGGSVPTGEDSLFQFLARPAKSGSYTFHVRQIYSDGSIVEWSGPESSDAPAPAIRATSSLGGGGGSSTLGIVGVVLGGVALLVAGLGLAARPGRRELA